MVDLFIANGKNSRKARRQWIRLYGNQKVPSHECIRKIYKNKFAKGRGPEDRHVYAERVSLFLIIRYWRSRRSGRFERFGRYRRSEKSLFLTIKQLCIYCEKFSNTKVKLFLIDKAKNNSRIDGSCHDSYPC